MMSGCIANHYIRSNESWIVLMFQVYGGYITSLLLSSEESVLKCAAVLSPITDFTLYGTVCVYVCVSVINT